MEALELDSNAVETLGSDLLAQILMGHHMVDFWINICVCHSLIVEQHPSGRKIYQVVSNVYFTPFGHL